MPSASTGLKRKGSWTAEEDALLRRYIERFGTEDCWRNVPDKAGLMRSGKSCRMRWINYLRPDVKHGSITAEEEDLIARLHKLLGNRWSLIAGRLPGRTDNEIKNFWKCHVRKKHTMTDPGSGTCKRRRTGDNRDMFDVLASPSKRNSFKVAGVDEMVTASVIREVCDRNIWNNNINRPSKLFHDRTPECDSIPVTSIPQQNSEITSCREFMEWSCESSQRQVGNCTPKRLSDPTGQAFSSRSSPCFALTKGADPENCRQQMDGATTNYLPSMEQPTLDFLTGLESSSFTSELTSNSSVIRDFSSTCCYLQESGLQSSPSDCQIFPASSPETLSLTSCIDKEEELKIKNLYTSKTSSTFSSAMRSDDSCASVVSADTSLDNARGLEGDVISDLQWMETTDQVESIHHSHLCSANDVLGGVESSSCGHLYSAESTWEQFHEDLVYFKSLFC
eukprot:c17960_g1_i1 orf=1-1347(-)